MRPALRLALAAACLASVVAPSYAQTEWSPSHRTQADTPAAIAPAGSQVRLTDRNNSGDSGYWIVVGSVPTQDPVAWERAGREVMRKAANCGFETFNDYSDNFVGFRAGYNVFVLGPHGSAAAAEPTRQAVSRCIGDAYVKYGEHVKQ